MPQFSTSPQNTATDKAACHVQLTVTPALGVVAFVEIRAYRTPQAGLVPSKVVARRTLVEALASLDGYQFPPSSVSFKDCPQAAINFGDDVNTGPAAAPANEGASSVAGAAQATASAVPFGNTGTTTIPTDL